MPSIPSSSNASSEETQRPGVVPGSDSSRVGTTVIDGPDDVQPSLTDTDRASLLFGQVERMDLPVILVQWLFDYQNFPLSIPRRCLLTLPEHALTDWQPSYINLLLCERYINSP